MRILVTAGPTREYIDTVRFITNASSGRMGTAVAAAAARAGHQVTLVLAEGCGAAAAPPAANEPGVDVVTFVTFDDLRKVLDERFESCDVLVMAAAVGDFRPEKVLPAKLSRRAGPVTLRLIPTEDILGGLAGRKRASQRIVAFAVEDGPPEKAQAKARQEMPTKGADFVVVNTPQAMSSARSQACILSRAGVAAAWAERSKEDLAREIVRLL